jgi:cytoskeletal protein RodZ
MERQQIIETQNVYPSEPHFDEERTLLSARPVVPLGELNAKASSRGWLLLTGGIAFAILLGAGTAVLIVQLEQRRVEPAISVSSKPANTQQSENVSAPVDTSDVSSPNDTANTLSSESPVTPLKGHQVEKVAIAQKTNVSSRQPDAIATDSENVHQLPASNIADPNTEGAAQSMSDRKDRREQRWEERRLRREASRDRRDNNRDPSADLFRIREIFEGTRRPD